MNVGTFKPAHTHSARLDLALNTAVIVAAIATVPLVIAEELGIEPSIIAAVDWLVWSVFMVEYIVMFGSATDRLAYVRRSWLAAAIIILSFPGWHGAIELVRLARLGRVLRLALVTWRAAATLRAVFGRRELIEVGAISAAVVLLGGGLLAAVEPDTVKGDYWAGVWWAATTATTVGYGDIAPTTLVGRLIGVVVMIVGIAAVSTFVAAIAGHFVQQDRHSELRDIRAQLERIESRLERMTSEREEHPPS